MPFVILQGPTSLRLPFRLPFYKETSAKPPQVLHQIWNSTTNHPPPFIESKGILNLEMNSVGLIPKGTTSSIVIANNSTPSRRWTNSGSSFTKNCRSVHSYYKLEEEKQPCLLVSSPPFLSASVKQSPRRGNRLMAAASTSASASSGLKKGIAEFYDESSGVWEDIWGDHMHHGFYEPDSSVSLSDHRAAQIRMIEEALRFASLSSDDPTRTPSSIVDVGCGIGGSSRYLAKKFGAQCRGITLSPVQAQRAQALADSQGLDGKVSFQVADALNQPFPDGQFDLVWSMESGEHMPDKTKFVRELARVAAPGGTIIIVTWCHRDLAPDEQSLRPEEQALLNKICDAFYLPAWCSTSDYVKLLQSESLQDIKSADWSEYVAPFWPAVINSALTWKGITSLLRSGWKTVKGAFAMPLMIEGYKKGLIKFAIITCRKPN